MKTKIFFDNVSDFFDNMTDASKVISMRKELLKKFLTPKIKTAVDLGCGTGSDSISLGLNDLDVTGFDISGKMIEKAKINSKKYNLDLRFFKHSLDKIPSKFNDKFDFAISLGNSLALVEENKIKKSAERIFKILNHNGIFVMQILNYTAIKKADSRIVNITQNPPNVYVRFYDFFTMPLNFNILRFNRDNPKDFELLTTKLFPYEKDYLFAILKNKGFKNIKAYSSLNKDKFDRHKSKDLIIVAYKN
ncbi:MAG: methyltransferase domain-containing protein [Ignavibacteriae bacterium]|nr:methyltransferase domain-containing protein [Ignavibacteriota bacterium]